MRAVHAYVVERVVRHTAVGVAGHDFDFVEKGGEEGLHAWDIGTNDDYILLDTRRVSGH